MKVEILTDLQYLLSTCISKEMLLENTSGQSRFELL